MSASAPSHFRVMLCRHDGARRIGKELAAVAGIPSAGDRFDGFIVDKIVWVKDNHIYMAYVHMSKDNNPGPLFNGGRGK